jgi:alanine-synthesizing transaminase
MNQSGIGEAGFLFARRTDWELTPNPLSRALEAHRQSGRELLDLTESNPTRCGFRYNAGEILKSFLDPANLSYAPDPQGWLNARKAVAGYYAAHGAAVDPANVLLTTGTSEGYNFLFRLLCDPGSEILLPRPSYPLLDYLVGLNDLHARRYELIYDHGWHLDFGSLRSVAGEQSRAVVVIHPNNPTGSYVSAQECQQLNDFCRERQMALIADEVFLDFALRAPEPSFAANDVLTFVLSGISKISGLPQMKLAWIVAAGPQAARQAALQRLELIADTFLSLSTPTQRALPMLLEQRHDMIGQLRRRIAANLRELDAQLARQQLVQRLATQGGWYAVLRVPATRSDDDLALALLQQRGVFVHPGHFYEFSGDGYLVLSLIGAEGVFRTGIERLLEFIA